ncbi:3'-5' exonuclease [uncultured Selenomonas sp.]|uniref:3'-5' exonuclease n=1 Tax=uncultured Selenomonas sp. TaxID=159275 RepID=UPI0025D6E576|nr:3'-5' exonuclease [uncultured Selenomonas sp.]
MATSRQKEIERIHEERLARLQEMLKEPPKTASTICIDTETTGLKPEENGIVELAIVSAESEILFHERLNPGDVRWTRKATEVNGISRKDVAGELTLDDYRPIIQAIFDAADTIIGYNTDFDLDFLAENGIIPRHAKVVDVMTMYSYVVGQYDEYHGDYRYQKLTRCAAQYKYKWTEKAHGALADALATIYCYPKVAAAYDKKRNGGKERKTSGKTSIKKQAAAGQQGCLVYLVSAATFLLVVMGLIGTIISAI